MNATILKIDKRKARDGGNFWYIFFKSFEGRSYRTCVYEKYRNFSNWYDIIKGNKIGLMLTGLIAGDKIVDADSDFKILKAAPQIPDASKVAAIPDNAPKVNVITNFCDLCGNQIAKGEITCNMKVNIGAEIEENCSGEIDKSADEYINLIIHIACRDEIFNKIGAANSFERKKIDDNLILIAKTKAAK